MKLCHEMCKDAKIGPAPNITTMYPETCKPEDMIAFHLVNAKSDEKSMKNTLLTVKLMKDIVAIIQYHFGIIIDEESLSYSRFITHLQFFIQRLLEEKMVGQKMTSVRYT